MKTLSTTILLLFLTFIVKAQTKTGMDLTKLDYELSKLKNLTSSKEGKNLSESEVAGNAYLDKQFQKSYVLKKNGAEIKDMQLRYNLYNNSMEMIQNGQILVISFPSEIKRINMGGKVFIYAKCMTPIKIGFSFLQMLYEGEYQLLKKDQVILKEPVKANQEDSLRFVRIAPQYYLRYSEGTAYLINSQKSLIKRLQPIPQQIIDYIKSKKIKAYNEAELIDLLKFIEDSSN